MTRLHPIILLVFLLTSCYSVKKSVDAAQPYSSQIQWPEAYLPENARFYVHNQIDIDAPPEVVWNILIQAENWPNWYEGASNVDVLESVDGMLKDGSVFTWQTMGLDFTSTIKEYKPFERLSWESVKGSIKGYHAWLIIPMESGCKLVTDESQHGWLTLMEKTFQPKKLHRLHDVWLSQIKQKAER